MSFQQQGPEKDLKHTEFYNSVMLLNVALLMLPMHGGPDSTHLVLRAEMKYLRYGVIQLPSMNDECLPGTIQLIGGLTCHLEVPVSRYGFQQD